MKSGLEGRNNQLKQLEIIWGTKCRNEVRPRRPEQSGSLANLLIEDNAAAMKSGLEGRNNFIDRLSRVMDPEAAMKSGLEGRNNAVT